MTIISFTKIAEGSGKPLNDFGIVFPCQNIWHNFFFRNVSDRLSSFGFIGNDALSTTQGYNLRNGEKYGAVIQVRKDGVKVLLDGKQLIALKSLSDAAVIKRQNIHLWAWNNSVVFHSVQITELSGDGKVVAIPVSASTAFNPVGRWVKADGTSLTLRGDHSLVFLKVTGKWTLSDGNFSLDFNNEWGHRSCTIVDENMFIEDGAGPIKRVK